MTRSGRRRWAIALILAVTLGVSACDALQDTATEVECSQDALSGEDDTLVFTSAYRVVDGDLGELCFGSDDPTIVAAWGELATIAPQGQRTDLELFGGFRPEGDEAADTLAFVNPLYVDGSQFQMSVNTVEAAADRTNCCSHWLTSSVTCSPQRPSNSTGPTRQSTVASTYYNGDGCYLDGSLIEAWIDEFWPTGMLDDVDPDEDSPEGADERSAIDDGFFGPCCPRRTPRRTSRRRSARSCSGSNPTPTGRRDGSIGSAHNPAWRSSTTVPTPLP